MIAFQVLVNIVFTLFFWVLIWTFCWEARVKINFVAKKILLSKHKTFHYTYLVVNLVQMLVCFTLIAILRISKVSLFPGQDYSLVCFYFFIVKTLQLRQESLLQDSFGLLAQSLVFNFK